MVEAGTQTRGIRKERQGVVVSRTGDKSIKVTVERRRRHPLYGKVIKEHHNFHAHDEKNEAQVGDTVRIVECRPISRLKRWRLAAIVDKVNGED